MSLPHLNANASFRAALEVETLLRNSKENLAGVPLRQLFIHQWLTWTTGPELGLCIGAMNLAEWHEYVALAHVGDDCSFTLNYLTGPPAEKHAYNHGNDS